MHNGHRSCGSSNPDVLKFSIIRYCDDVLLLFISAFKQNVCRGNVVEREVQSRSRLNRSLTGHVDQLFKESFGASCKHLLTTKFQC